MDIKSAILFVSIFIIVIALHIAWAKHRINQWATRNDYKIIECKICLTNIGPFSYFGTSGGQSIFRIKAINGGGIVKKGYARAGGFFFGLLRKRVEVKWDKIPLGQ
ncbi:MAG: hypothetical protein AMJ53_12600 [Gammaproteobacteria bacterium SG8_11]|jgi:hypothetical protein|nr:MAG: hypothetical protein AMJ53_12600 [Gammaproteobacteria bacterium SG8_11]